MYDVGDYFYSTSFYSENFLGYWIPQSKLVLTVSTTGNDYRVFIHHLTINRFHIRLVAARRNKPKTQHNFYFTNHND